MTPVPADHANPRPAEPAWARWAFYGGLAFVGGWIAALPELPLQDLPNHLYILDVDRALRAGAQSDFWQAPDRVVLGYSLHVWLARALALAMPVGAALRVVVLAAALGLPWAIARAARRVGAAPYLTGILALPLALSWPLKIGLLPFALALPFVALAGGAAAQLVEEPNPSRRARILAALWPLATWLAHPLALFTALTVMGAAFLTLGRRTRSSLARLAVTTTPAFAAAAYDLARGNLSPIAGTDSGWMPLHPFGFRDGGDALAQLFTRSYGIADRAMLVAFAPLAAALVWAAWRGRRALAPRAFAFLALAAGLLALESVLAPAHVGAAYLFGARLAAPFAIALTWLAGASLAGARGRAAVAAAAALALVASLRQLDGGARAVAELGTAQPLAPGRYLTVRVSRPGAGAPEWLGAYDPLRHTWARAASPDAVTPYAFAFARYLPVWYRGDQYERRLAAPKEWTLEAEDRARTPELARVRNRDRVLAAVQSGPFDGVLVYGPPPQIDEAMDQLRVLDPRFARLGPGFLLIKRVSSAAPDAALAER